MENEIFTLVGSVVITTLTQISKKYFPTMNPMAIVAAFSVVLGLSYVLFLDQPTADIMSKKIVETFAYATAIFQVLKQFSKLK